jgi:hypothetical protein
MNGLRKYCAVQIESCLLLRYSFLGNTRFEHHEPHQFTAFSPVPKCGGKARSALKITDDALARLDT